eukprot:9240498-Pyramimonas_sp.AAC.1
MMMMMMMMMMLIMMMLMMLMMMMMMMMMMVKLVWVAFRLSLPPVRQLGGALCPSWAVLEPSCAGLGLSSAVLGPSR